MENEMMIEETTEEVIETSEDTELDELMALSNLESYDVTELPEEESNNGSTLLTVAKAAAVITAGVVVVREVTKHSDALKEETGCWIQNRKEDWALMKKRKEEKKQRKAARKAARDQKRGYTELETTYDEDFDDFTEVES